MIAASIGIFSASTFALTSAGAFFFFGLVFGAWKYACMARSAEAESPVYVDIAHRAALLYSFACVLVAKLCAVSVWSNAVNLAAAIVLIAYFAIAVFSYALHGALRDTDNQLKRPHRLGGKTIGVRVMRAVMISMVVAEIGAFLVIFSGYLAAAPRPSGLPHYVLAHDPPAAAVAFEAVLDLSDDA